VTSGLSGDRVVVVAKGVFGGVGRVVGTLQQTGEVVGGTGRFAAASGGYTATVTRPGLLARNPDGGCSFEQPALHEVDMFAITGTLLF